MKYRFTLQSARRYAGISANDMAERLGVTLRTVSNWETGKVIPKTAFIVMWANICGVDVKDIFLPIEFNKIEQKGAK